MTVTARLGRLLREVDRRLLADNLAFYPRVVEQELAGEWGSLLDVGCGAGSAVEHVLARVPFTVGIDAHAPTVERRRADGPYARYECVGALDAADHFGARSFDVVVAMDVIEHFDKEDGHRLLDGMETLARARVIVCTPNGFLQQGALDGNPLQIHRAGWHVDDFRRRGYRVVGVNGWRPLRGERSEPRIRPPVLGHRLAAATQPLVTSRPQHAFQLLAVRDLSPPPA